MLLLDVREALGSSATSLEEDARTWVWESGESNADGGERAAWQARLQGNRLGDFEVFEEVGRGGMGIVYRARQVSLNRLVALKVLPPALQRRPSSLARFRREAHAVARLKHPNIVPVYAQGEHEGCLFYAMEFVEGVSLDVAIRTRPEMLTSDFWGIDPKERNGKKSKRERCPPSPTIPDAKPAARAPVNRTAEDFKHIALLAAGAADGLAHAAQHGVIHRDIKPQNLLLGTDRQLHITDFGLALLQDEPHLTVGGEVMGTAAYLAPEQLGARGTHIDHRTDIYALGATLYEMLTGRRPFDGDSRDEILSNIKATEPPPPRSVDRTIPRDLETICLKAMAKDASCRYAAAALLAEDLRRFAEDRPISGRRPGPVEVGLRYWRRRRATVLAGLTGVVALVLVLAWIMSAFVHQREDADRILKEAYDRLAYIDYRMPDLVLEQVERAEALGADPFEVNITRALIDLGKQQNGSAVMRLGEAITQNPGDRRALYLLAWAQWRSGDHASSQLTFEQTETLGGADTADAWFFRGLAAHFERPAVALESYRKAIALRATNYEFYPQAVLHLARARNQEMYTNRSLATFDDAESGLRQLITHDHYGAYPYYLLSITHRLAGEILAAQAGRIDVDADSHFRQALEWGRAGQERDPLDNRVVTAEAECLESLGQFNEAIAARTRAIELAQRSLEKWEGHHYRWRLYYWVGQFDEALADLNACLGYSPDNRFYAFVYPALVYAEMGEQERARALARELFTEGSTDGLAAIWSATTLRLLGQAEEARSMLRSSGPSLEFKDAVPPQTEAWLTSLFAHCVGEESFEDLLLAAQEAGPDRGLLAEAHFHAGAVALAEGDAEQALERFTDAYRSYDSEQAYTFHAKTVWQMMRQDPSWPLWLTNSQNPFGGD